MNNVVVIPIYKEKLSSDEIRSLEQCFRVLYQHPIIFVAPENLTLDFYKTVIGKDLTVEFFAPEYFKNISGYNSLMLSQEFYQRFSKYNYMLIYQLDCYVFSDQFTYWCQQDYDYIGSPWFDYSYYSLSKIKKVFFLIKQKIKFLVFPHFFSVSNLTNQVGNGGFSLRKIKSFQAALSSYKSSDLQIFKDSNDAIGLYNEDVFFSFFAKNIKKPNYKKAVQFSIDNAPPIGMSLNKNKLPFGCHAWKRNMTLWKMFTNEFNN